MLKILLVDDSKSAQLKICEILSQYGKCDQAYNGIEAVDFFSKSLQEQTPYDLIIMDLVMPKMDGFEASKKIMEEVIMAYSTVFPVTTARFANVAFSNGSLLDGFVSRMMKRQPLSAPSDVKRYFVSPEESGQICLLSCMLGC